jgi:hypothetical protein
VRRRRPSKPFRRPRRRNQGGDQSSDPARHKEAFWWAVAIAVVAGLVLAAVSGAASWARSLLDGESGGGRLELVGKPAVSNGVRDAAMIEHHLIRSSESAPKIDVAVRNVGTDPVQIAEARVTIIDSARLSQCKIGGGEIPRSRPYEIDLVANPTPGERVVEEDIREEVPPGHAYRLVLAFDSETSGLDEQLFALKVELIAEPPDQELDLGRFVLGVPEPISRGGSILPEDEWALTPLEGYALEEAWCYRYNYAEVQRLTARPGLRAAEIAALSDAPMTPGWSPAVGVKEARAAVEPLLHAEFYPASLAVFAAEQTGDERLVDQTRERAAAKILGTVERSLDAGEASSSDAMAVRQAMGWVPSESAEDLLRRVEAELQANLEEELAE